MSVTISTLDNTAEIVDITEERGDTLTLNLDFDQSDGTPYDLTGWTIWLTIKTSRGDGDNDATHQVEKTAFDDPTSGTATITVAASTTADLAGTYHYDIQVEDGTGTISTEARGTIEFVDDTTRATA